MRFLLVVVVGLLSGWSLQAQKPEKLAIHFDKPFYVTGEVIWYNLYLPKSFAGQSVSLKIVLTAPAGEQIETYVLATEGETSLPANFKLPYELEPAMYRLSVLGYEQAAGEWLKLAEVFIPVYNDLLPDNPPNGEVTTRFAPGPGVDDLEVSIQLPQDVFQTRELIQAEIRVRDSAGNPVPAALSVSVVDADLLGTAAAGRLDLKLAEAERPYLPNELSEEIWVSGRITDETGRPRTTTNVGVFKADNQKSFVFETTENGRFGLALPNFVGRSTIQFVDLRDDSLRVSMDEGIRPTPAPPLPFNEAVREYLKWSRDRKVIYQLYNTVETPLERIPEKKKVMPLEPDQRIIPKEYTAFEDLYTFFTEVSTPLKVRFDDERGYYAQMFNPNPRMRMFYQKPPVFIVDGQLTRDVNFLQSLHLSQIDTIDLYFDFLRLNEQFDKLGSNGVVVVKTSLPSITVPAPDRARTFSVAGYLPDSQIRADQGDRSAQPVFKPQLHWQTGIQTDDTGTAPLQFTQSDDLGTFLINVVVQSRDGRLGYGTKTYQVAWKTSPRN